MSLVKLNLNLKFHKYGFPYTILHMYLPSTKTLNTVYQILYTHNFKEKYPQHVYYQSIKILSNKYGGVVPRRVDSCFCPILNLDDNYYKEAYEIINKMYL